MIKHKERWDTEIREYSRESWERGKSRALETLFKIMRLSVEENDLESLTYYLDNYGDPNWRIGHLPSYGFFELVEPYESSIEAIKLLVNRGLRVDDDEAEHFFCKSLKYHNFEIAEFLIDHGVDVNGTTRCGEPFVMSVAGDLLAIEFLLDRGVKINPGEYAHHRLLLMESAKRGMSVSGIKRLLDRGADLNATDYEGNTILTIVIRSRLIRKHKLELLKLLLDRGADTYVQNNEGKDCLYYALQRHEVYVELIEDSRLLILNKRL